MVERITISLNRYRALPKVELHRNLEGTLRLDTMIDIAQKHGIPIGSVGVYLKRGLEALRRIWDQGGES